MPNTFVKQFSETSRVAGVVELVDTTDSKSVAFAGVPVQVRLPVPLSIVSIDKIKPALLLVFLCLKFVKDALL